MGGTSWGRSRLPRRATRTVAPGLWLGSLWLSVCVASIMGAAIGNRPAFAEDPPWQTWTDLRRLAELPAGDRVLLRDSHCLSGCRFDRHSEGDPRYLRVEDGEGVIFDEPGAGAIVRIWMTTGGGTSQPLPEDVTMFVYLDGASEPTLSLPLPAYFDGSTPPFVAPLAGDREVSSGGNFSYVPISYRQGCKITLVGADDDRLWYQFTYHRLADAEAVTTFTGNEDLSGLAGLLNASGTDPWTLKPPGNSSTSMGNVMLSPGESAVLAQVEGAGSFTALRMTTDPAYWPEVELKLTFDGRETVSMPLSDVFAVGRGGLGSTRSLFAGVDAEGTLYLYFPMPFFSSADVRLSRQETVRAAGADPAPITWQIRRDRSPPSPESGHFGAALGVDDETPIGTDIPLLHHDGRGRWVGLFVDLGSVDTTSRQYLEGDERIYLDGSRHPNPHGTGTEDFFNGGFYFDQGSFLTPLHGSPYHLEPAAEDVTAAYRWFLTDPVPFEAGIRAGLEGGPTSNLSVRVRTVAYHYTRPEQGLWRWDVLDLGDAGSRSRHDWSASGDWTLQGLDGEFEGEPPESLQGTGVYRPGGSVSFHLRVPEGATRLRLRRLFDAGLGGQQADVKLEGKTVASFPPVPENPDRRWREEDLDLPESAVPQSDALDLTIVALPNPAIPPPNPVFTEFRYELWADVDPTLFADGFESGDLSGWSAALP